MEEMELLQDVNLLVQYINIMRDCTDPAELNRYHSMAKKKLDEVYKDKKGILKHKK